MDYIEIERKFLLKKLPKLPSYKDFLIYEQGYLPGKTIKERLTIHYTNPVKYRRAVKIGSGEERFEFKEKVNKEVFEMFWPLTEGRRIKKQRYWVQAEGKLVWEIDEFLDRKLFIAEIETPKKGYPIKIPSWLKSVIIREVTEEKEFEGFNIAQQKISNK